MCLAHKKTSLPRKVGANGQYTAWTIASSKKNRSSLWIDYYSYFLLQLETNSQRNVWLTRKPHVQEKLELKDISLPGQLLWIKKIDLRCELMNKVLSYYSWKLIQGDVPGSQENLARKKSWSKRSIHYLGNCFKTKKWIVIVDWSA